MVTMIEQWEWKRIFLSFNPYCFMTCFAIFHIARGDAARNGAIDNGPPVDHQLLGNFIDEAALATDFYACGIHKSDGVLNEKTDLGYTTLDFLVEDIIEDLKVKPDFDENNESLMLDREAKKEDRIHSMFDDTVQHLYPAVDKIQNAVCRKHSRMFLHQLKRYKMWAMQMYDSSAKHPSGVLNGNLNQLGDYDQCLAVSATEGTEHVVGKYCLAQFDVAVRDLNNTSQSLKEAVDMIQAFGLIRSTANDPGHFIPQFTTINWAVCLPASCSSEDVEVALTETLNSLTAFRFSVRVQPEMCYVKQDHKTLGNKTLAAICSFAFIIGVAMVATMKDSGDIKNVSYKAGKLERVMMAFSLKRNWASLVATLPIEGDIHCIHGIRAICTIMLYAAHKLIPVSMTPLVNRVAITEVSNESASIVFRASLIYTDSFLLLSGVLTAYNLSKEMQKTGTIDWRKRSLARFIRLTPALAALVVFYAFIVEHLGEGPLWGRVIQQNADLCKRGFWTNILYIQNFFPFEHMCATQTHQLALDMQLSLISPFLVYVLYKYPVGGGLLLVLLHTAATALRYFVTIHNNLSLIIYHGMPVSQLYRTANLSYSLSTHRSTPYLMGVAVGYLLHKYEKSANIPKPAVIIGWLAAGMCSYLSVFSYSHVASRDISYDPVEAAQYAAFSPITWSLALGWTICACELGHGGALNRILSCRGLVMLSRISYAMYLTQFLVFFYNVGTLRSSQTFLLTHAVSLEELLVVVLVSITMTLLFDLPMQDVKGILTGGGGLRSKLDEKTHRD